MLKNIIISLFWISCNLFADESIEITPIHFDLNAIENKGDTLITMGTFGSGLLSFDNGDTWKQIKAFESGEIIKLFIEEDRVIAFNINGEIAESNDFGLNWDIKTKLNDSISAVIEYTNGFILRTYQDIFLIDSDFNISKKIEFKTRRVNRNLTNSIFFHNNQIHVATDTMRIVRYFSSGILRDTIELNEIFKTDHFFMIGGFIPIKDSVYFDFSYTLYKTKNFVRVDSCCQSIFGISKNINEEYYKLSYNEYISSQVQNQYFHFFKLIEKDFVLLNEFENKSFRYSKKFNDFCIIQNNIFLVGENKSIFKLNSDDDDVEVKSDFVGYTNYEPPIKLNDSSFVFLNEIHYGQAHPPTKTNNFGTTIKPLIYTDNIPLDRGQSFFHSYYDEMGGQLYYLINHMATIKNGVLRMDLNSYEINFFQETGFSSFPRIINNRVYKNPGINLYKNTFVTFRDDLVNHLDFFNNNFEKIANKRFKDNILITYATAEDTNRFLVLFVNFDTDSLTTIKYTEDSGETWSEIKKYSKTKYVYYYKELNYQNNKILALFNYDEKDSIIALDFLDLNTHEIQEIYRYKEKHYKYYYNLKNAIDIYNDTLYLAINDTIFVGNDPYNRATWKEIRLPNNGGISLGFKVYENNLAYAVYRDDINPKNQCWLKLPALENPKPMISVSDHNFDSLDITSEKYRFAKIGIENLSDEVDLIINGFKQNNPNIFQLDLPEINEQSPLIIEPNDIFEINVKFQPDKLGFYQDTIIFSSNAIDLDSIAILNGKAIDTNDVHVEYEIEKRNYLFFFEPYPQPASNRITCKIYWDTSININDSPLEVVDSNGNSIEVENDVHIERINQYSGNLVWNCSKVKPGIYLIKITHGNATQTMKVAVIR